MKRFLTAAAALLLLGSTLLQAQKPNKGKAYEICTPDGAWVLDVQEAAQTDTPVVLARPEASND